MNNSTSFFFDPLDNESIDPKSDIDIDMEDIPLCDSCKNVILKPYKDHDGKLICSVCMRIYDPKWEYIQIQDKETTLDEIGGNQGKMGFMDEDKKIKQRTTLNRQNNNLEENMDYVKKEFDRYRQIEIIDKDTISNKLRRRQSNRE